MCYDDRRIDEGSARSSALSRGRAKSVVQRCRLVVADGPGHGALVGRFAVGPQVGCAASQPRTPLRRVLSRAARGSRLVGENPA